MKTRIGVSVIVVCLVIIAFGALWVWTVRHPASNQSATTTPTQVISYSVFTDKDNGSTTAMSVGSTVVIMLPEKQYKDPIIATSTEGTIDLQRDVYGGRTVGSFTVPTTTSITVRAQGIEATSTYILHILPYIQKQQ